MYLQRLLQINIATLAALGTLLLGMGQRDATLPMLMLSAAIASVWLTDVTGWFRLNRKVASLAALVAMAVGVAELLRPSGGDQFVGLARLLVYVQIVLLFQEKDQRTYRQLIMLSLLQVVVASILSQGVWFGVLLVGYMLVGFSALALFCLYSHGVSAGRSVPGREGRWSVGSGGGSGGRWPLASQEPVLASTPGGSSSAGVTGELFGRLTVIGLGTLELTLVLFFSLPRFGRPAWRGASVATQHVVGFSDQVTLGELGEIIQSPEEVMRVRLTDAASDDPYPVQGEVYLRGAVLTRYGGGQWENPGQHTHRRQAGGTRGTVPSFAAKKPIRVVSPTAPRKVGTVPLVLQKITVEPLDRDELFCVWPPVRLKPDDGLRRVGDRLLRPAAMRGRRFSFTLGTAVFVDGQQSELVPCDELVDTNPLLELPELPKLAAVAQDWIEQSGLAEADHMAQARELARRFHHPARFQYSLEGQVRDPDLDPIEDFVTKNPRGHCEYFASALALMLRSRGIPSRMVVGYRCDEYNDVGHFYQVRQWHAHSWVEAYLAPQNLPEGMLDSESDSRWGHGGWLRLEPTPGGDADQPAGAPQLGKVERGFRWLQSLWGNYVLEMDRDRQRTAIYDPAVRAVRRAIDHLRDPDWWRGLLVRLGRTLDVTAWAAGQWLAGILSLAVALPASIFVGRRVWRLSSRVWGFLAGRRRSRGGETASEVEFYARLETLLAAAGLRRDAGQTQREFAVRAGVEIARASGRPQLQTLPLQVVEAFYQVRFGRQPLDSRRAEAVEHALAELSAGPGE